MVYKLKSYGKLKHSDELGMMTEIARNGPITCSIATPDDMVYDFRGGILRKKDYSKSEARPAAGPQQRMCSMTVPGPAWARRKWRQCDRSGTWRAGEWRRRQVDHDVEVVGWGEEDGTPFWHVRNSWGTYWGELGFFRLERGTNALQMEAGDCWCAAGCCVRLPGGRRGPGRGGPCHVTPRSDSCYGAGLVHVNASSACFVSGLCPCGVRDMMQRRAGQRRRNTRSRV